MLVYKCRLCSRIEKGISHSTPTIHICGIGDGPLYYMENSTLNFILNKYVTKQLQKYRND